MHTLKNRIRQRLLAAAAVLAGPGAMTRGETFVADLALAAESGMFGEYLTASYDFGGAFADVQSVRVELDIPGGYMGTAMTTGNSSYYRSLFIQMHDLAVPPPAPFLVQYLGTSAIDIPPSDAAEFDFRRVSITFEGQVHYAAWPPFLLTGAGAVSLIDVNISSHHPLPDRENATSIVSWLPPTGIAGARLIVEATPIPEPSAAVLTILAAIAFGRRGRL
jgi:hypothetical protein